MHADAACRALLVQLVGEDPGRFEDEDEEEGAMEQEGADGQGQAGSGSAPGGAGPRQQGHANGHT